MLRSFMRHFNESVYRGPDTEGAGGDADLDTSGDTGGVDDNDAGDTGGGDAPEGASEERLTVREQLKKAMAETSEDDKSKTAAKPKREKSGRFGGEAKADPAAVTGKDPATKEVAADSAAPAVAAPESLPKEAKEAWANTPPAVQAAFVKREQDMAQGVAALKQRYELIDQAIAPHQEALRQMNATPADAVNRMFLWFKALAGRPTDAFPALAQSMGVDWAKLVGPAAASGDQAAAAGTASGGAPEIPEPVKAYVGQLEGQVKQLVEHVQQLGGQLGGIQSNFAQQSETKTRENLSIWSQGKPHFERVRQDMAQLIEKGVIPLKPDGQVDLDTAYERAIYFNPEVRALVIAEQQEANAKAQAEAGKAATTAQQAQVGRARKAATSLPVTAPGASNGAATKQKSGQKLSVRESLKQAVQQLRDQ